MSERINAYHNPLLTAEALAKEVLMHADFDVGCRPFPVAAGVSPAISSLAFAKP
jgi:hypothetical protein